MTGTNAGSPKGRESYGDGGPILVVGVTPHQGVRENRKQGEGGQVIGHSKTGRYARCETPKQYWVSSVNAVGRACRWKDCIDSCSTAVVSDGLRAYLLQPGGDDAWGHRRNRGRHVLE